MAAPKPNGTEKIAVPIVRYTVPMIAGRIPPAFIPSYGISVIKVQESDGSPSTMMNKSTAKIGTAVMTAVKMSAPNPTFSMMRRF
jgi:hypothetical protein